MRLCLAILALAVALAATPARAWNDHGHMLVAAIAWDQLTPATRARVGQLLALNPWPVGGINDAPAEAAAEARFMQAATAPDAIKGYRVDFIDDGDRAGVARDPGRNTGFDDRAMHKYWHFVDLPFSPDGTPVLPPPSINAQERIGLFRRVLASDAPDALKAYDLVWLLHLVGDIHQPLHATTRFTQDAPQGDAGGNLVKLCLRRCRDNLHAFWDGAAGTSRSVRETLRHAVAMPPAAPGPAAEAAWAEESLQAAIAYAYAAPVGPSLGPWTPDEAYIAQAHAAAEARVALAGARLARLLNTELR